jgi:hypothetical protein
LDDFQILFCVPGHETGDVPNPDILELVNIILLPPKMRMLEVTCILSYSKIYRREG